MATALELYLLSQLSTSPRLISSTVLAGTQASITVSVPSGFNYLQGVFTARKNSGGGGAFCWMQFNGDTSAHYQWQNLVDTTASTSGASLVTIMQVGLCAGASDTANYFATGTFTIGNASSTAVAKSYTSNSGLTCSTTTYYTSIHGGVWNQTSAITSVTLMPDAGSFIAGSSFSLYGVV